MELIDLKGVGEATLQKLNSMGIYTINDIVQVLPSDYMDLSDIREYKDIVEGEYILLRVCITDIKSNNARYAKTSYVKAYADCEDGAIELVWFNSPYITKSLECGEILVYGMVKYVDGVYTIYNPGLEKVSNIDKVKKIKPIYRLSADISSNIFYKIVCNALDYCDLPCFVDGVFDLNKAYRQIHMPESSEDINAGRATLCLYDLVKDLTAYRLVRVAKGENKQRNYTYPLDIELGLPYPLTKSQKQAVNDIYTDMISPKLMNRLVLGDVGSGKTFVALLGMAMAVEGGGQAVLLAPTEVLCTQHYDNAVKYLSKFGYRIAKLSGNMDGYAKRDILDRLAVGDIDMLIATHSCLNSSVIFADLRLAVIDEVHKFGVNQKAELEKKGDGVNMLSLSATPIPRSLAMNIYGDLDISKLERREGVIDNITTYIFGSDRLTKMCGYIKESVSRGDKCFVVCPRLQDNGERDIMSCKYMYKLLSSYVDKKDMGILYGSMTNQEKNDIMSAFREGEVHLLVSTTVVEVGVDVPDASKIFIMGADSYGLATLHQLRGRVGRDGKHAECFLHNRGVEVSDRLKAMKQINDGIRLASVDAKERGYGDIIGMRQSGKNNYERYHTKVTLDMVMRAKSIADIVDLTSVHIEDITRELRTADRVVLN